MNYNADDIVVLDDIVPNWLHEDVVKNIPHTPVTFGHRGLGPISRTSIL